MDELHQRAGGVEIPWENQWGVILDSGRGGWMWRKGARYTFSDKVNNVTHLLGEK